MCFCHGHTQADPFLLRLVVSPTLSAAMLGCAGPVGVDGSQAAAQIVAEGAQLNQSQVRRHLGLVLTRETRSYVHGQSFRAVHVQAKRFLHLPPVREDSEQPITAKHKQLGVHVCVQKIYILLKARTFMGSEDILCGPLTLRRV